MATVSSTTSIITNNVITTQNYLQAVQTEPIKDKNTVFDRVNNTVSSTNSIINRSNESIQESINSVKIDPLEWVLSGRAIAADYERYRQEANAHAVARNEYFSRATEAFLK